MNIKFTIYSFILRIFIGTPSVFLRLQPKKYRRSTEQAPNKHRVIYEYNSH
ncbi:hypothetical protein AACH28_11430 [Sphingobacterium thalpophilum]|uniref:Uncharacterized protein n=1 Tax=Sphingobacterium thalpophilum TaxID=259 RepID=A0ACD5C8E4_9SPHI